MRRFFIAPLILPVLFVLGGADFSMGQEPWLVDLASGFEDLGSECEGDAIEEKCCYGPGECPGTLLQWSRCASFSGGPAGMDEPLVADRPDFTESSVTVGRGVTQIEFGYTYEYDEDGTDRTRTHAYPNLLLRQGILAEWLEFRVGWSYVNEDSREGAIESGVDGSDDLSLGFKFSMTPQECMLPESALILQMSVPLGADGISADEVLPGIIYIYAWELNDTIGIAGSTAANRAIDDIGEAYTEIAQSAVMGIGLTDNLGAYVEWYAFFPHSGNNVDDEHVFNGGFTYHFTNNFMLDIEAGVGLTAAAPDYFVATGGAVRF
ncbi:MAG: transporter [Pirellulales bacterium]|nr:transporter [Pirellulales bacterium]